MALLDAKCHAKNICRTTEDVYLMCTISDVTGTWVPWHKTVHVFGERLASSRLQKCRTVMATSGKHI